MKKRNNSVTRVNLLTCGDGKPIAMYIYQILEMRYMMQGADQKKGIKAIQKKHLLFMVTKLRFWPRDHVMKTIH